MKENQNVIEMRLDGGNLSLNFVNTVDDRLAEPLKNLLHNYQDLINWVHFADGIDSSLKKRLLELSREKQKKANQIYHDSILLREAIYQVTVSLIREQEAPQVDLDLFNQWLSRSFSNLILIQVDNGFVLDWDENKLGLDRVLWPIIRSFVDLITSEDRRRIKQCSNCGWLFVDNSKNKSRRWCSMEICGNQVKARRYANKIRT